jgi:hypothetical protein
VSERLYSDKIQAKLSAYFNKYGWSLLRGAAIEEMLNDAFKEGQASKEGQ